MTELYDSRNNFRNVCSRFINCQATGRKSKYGTVPLELFQSGNPWTDFGTLWVTLRKLDEIYFATPFDGAAALEGLQSLQKMVEEADSMHFNNDTRRGKDFTICHIFHIQGGVEVILRMIFHPAIKGRNDVKPNEIQQKIRMYCMEILHAVCLSVDSIALTIGGHDNLISYLFVLMEDKKIFLIASTLLEELLAVNRKIVDLSNISNLQNLVGSLRDSSFPGFCRILSTAVADIDLSDEKCTLLAQDKEEKDRSLEKSLADKNQELLLNHPEFLSRMVKVASKAFPGGYQIPQGFQRLAIDNVPFHFAGFQEMFSSDNNLPGTSSDGGNNHGEGSSSSSSSSFLDVPSERSSTPSTSMEASTWIPLSVQMMNEVMHKVEILYVLTLFLCGKYKFEVQSKLSELKFIPTLSDLFDKLGWNNEIKNFPRHNYHESGDCDCTPESALKIQFLRFIHSFCDHNEKRYLLLSTREMQEIKQVCEKYGYPKPVSLSKSKYRCQGNKGLITKIIDVLKGTAPDNALRFWLSRAVEGFLRGAVFAPDQHFLINRGLIKHLYCHIVNSDTKVKEIIQSSFDLLGELMKFSETGFQEFNNAIENDTQFESFLSVMTSNVVDSNMFIRCSVLSHEKFLSSPTYNMASCRLCKLIRKWEQRIYLMYKLITSVSVESLTQENVSCLNTTLIFLMFAYNHGQLDKYLQAFVNEEEAQDHPGLILSNLRDLLFFWKSHYLRRGKDCSQLEQSSSITFDKWQKVVDVMLSEDITKNTSILYYLTPKYRNGLRFRNMDFLARDV